MSCVSFIICNCKGDQSFCHYLFPNQWPLMSFWFPLEWPFLFCWMLFIYAIAQRLHSVSAALLATAQRAPRRSTTFYNAVETLWWRRFYVKGLLHCECKDDDQLFALQYWVGHQYICCLIRFLQLNSLTNPSISYMCTTLVIQITVKED